MQAMSLLAASQVTAVATVVLAAGAIVTGVFAFLAFRKQSQEVRSIERQVTDQEALTAQQAELLRIQGEQAELQRQQLEEQRGDNARQAEVMALQADELRESLEERKRDREQRRSAQAARVFIWERDDIDTRGLDDPPSVVARVRNSSEQPVYGVVLIWRRGTMRAGSTVIGTVVPGEEAEDKQFVPEGTSPNMFGAVAFFRDATRVYCGSNRSTPETGNRRRRACGAG
jgi:hypothetical protein